MSIPKPPPVDQAAVALMTVDEIAATPTFTVKQAAAILRCCDDVAYRLAREGGLPGAHRLGSSAGSRYIVRGPILAAFLRGEHQPASGEPGAAA